VARTPSELLQGTVDILILRALAWEPMHGYAISRWLDARSDGVLTVDGAALYQALHRIQQRKVDRCLGRVISRSHRLQIVHARDGVRERKTVGVDSLQKRLNRFGRFVVTARRRGFANAASSLVILELDENHTEEHN